jgi:hypothetical protein
MAEVWPMNSIELTTKIIFTVLHCTVWYYFLLMRRSYILTVHTSTSALNPEHITRTCLRHSDIHTNAHSKVYVQPGLYNELELI